MNALRIVIVSLCMMSAAVLASCEDEPDEIKTSDKKGLAISSQKTFKLALTHSFGNTQLAFSPTEFVTLNDTIRLTELRYYLTNITLTTFTGQVIPVGNYDLIDVDAAQPSNTLSYANIPEGNYRKISFIIGVDSIRNSSGAQEGALDPNNGMFWTWNTGYIFFKARGRYSSTNSFALDIGGTGNQMGVSFDLDNYLSQTDAPTIAVNLDMEKVFNSPNAYNLGVDADQIHNSGNSSIPKLRSNVQGAFVLKGIN